MSSIVLELAAYQALEADGPQMFRAGRVGPGVSAISDLTRLLLGQPHQLPGYAQASCIPEKRKARG